ncbi:hypothetical protein ACIQXA_37585 [Streptomyces massasporeus]|uniref:hypothetical protein n=1 Tax=Streptomyces massasporeus TaxID=67324 RepID=UPI0038101984
MDLQGIGAIAAAVVAAVGIPAALLVGRWQMRAAMRAAEEAGRAGIAQAEATYRAALDAVRAEAGNAHDQWRRSLRRDAYSELLLAVHRVRTAALLLTSGSSDERRARIASGTLTTQRAALREAEDSLTAAWLVVTLEGPRQAAVAAEGLVNACQAFSKTHKIDAIVEEAQHSLSLANQGTLVPGHPLPDFMATVEELRQLVIESYEHEELIREIVRGEQDSPVNRLRNRAYELLNQMPELHSPGLTVLAQATITLDLDDREETVSQLNRAQCAFLAAAQSALDVEAGTQSHWSDLSHHPTRNT